MNNHLLGFGTGDHLHGVEKVEERRGPSLGYSVELRAGVGEVPSDLFIVGRSGSKETGCSECQITNHCANSECLRDQSAPDDGIAIGSIDWRDVLSRSPGHTSDVWSHKASTNGGDSYIEILTTPATLCHPCALLLPVLYSMQMMRLHAAAA